MKISLYAAVGLFSLSSSAFALSTVTIDEPTPNQNVGHAAFEVMGTAKCDGNPHPAAYVVVSGDSMTCGDTAMTPGTKGVSWQVSCTCTGDGTTTVFARLFCNDNFNNAAAVGSVDISCAVTSPTEVPTPMPTSTSTPGQLPGD